MTDLQRAIETDALIPEYTRYNLGKHRIDDNVTGLVPVYIEGRNGHWVVPAKLGEMNHWYLNTEPHDQYFTMKDKTKKFGYTTYWRYKVYSRFTTLDEAVSHFNRVAYGDLKQKPSEVELSHVA